MTETATDRFPGRAHSSSPVSTRSRTWTYTERSDSEAALERLVALLRSGTTRIAIEGAPGAGKTVLLHVLPDRLGPSFASAYLPHPGLDPAGVRAWLENFAGPLPADAGSTFEDLASAYARRGPGLVLLIDDADAMPEAIAREFGSLLERTDAALRIVVAGVPSPSLEAVLAALGERVPRVRLGASSESLGIREGALAQLTRAPSEYAASESRVAREGPAPRVPIGEASEPLHAREGALARLARAPTGFAASESRAARQESPAPSAPSIETEPTPARPHMPPPSSAVRSPPPPVEATDPPPTAVVEKRLQVPANAVGETEREAGRAAHAAAAPALRPLPRPARAAWLRAAGIAGVAVAATAALVLLLLRSDTRDGRLDVALPPSVEAPPPPVEASPPPVEAPPPAPVAAAPPVPVHVNARPWARIFVDGQELGVTPLGNVPIEPGLRRFRAELADGRVVERDVRVEDADQKVTFP